MSKKLEKIEIGDSVTFSFAGSNEKGIVHSLGEVEGTFIVRTKGLRDRKFYTHMVKRELINKTK